MTNMSKTEITRTHKIFLAIGLLFILLGIFLQIFLNRNLVFNTAVLYSIIVAFVGAVFLYIACLKKTSMWKFAVGLFLTWGGLFFVIVEAYFYDYSLKTLWPVLVSLAGAAIICSAIFSKRRITFSILMPSIVLVIMGVLFLFFSLDIIKDSFISVVTNLLPFLLMISGVVLFGSYFYVQSGRQHINPELIEDNDED